MIVTYSNATHLHEEYIHILDELSSKIQKEFYDMDIANVKLVDELDDIRQEMLQHITAARSAVSETTFE